MTSTTTARIRKLSMASHAIVEPDDSVAGVVDRSRPMLPRELLSIVGLDIELTAEQERLLAQEEVAAVVDAGIRFEALLLCGFGRQLAYAPELTDDRVVYVLHELGEETRHSRLFIRLLEQVRPAARNPFLRWPTAAIDRALTSFVLRRPLLFCVMVLAGEEVPDLFQKRVAEHPGTDPFFRAVSRYHRAEEARHLAYARLILPELWARAGWSERFLVRRLAPAALRAVADSLVHPGVYEVVGLAGWKTWRAANGTPQRQEVRAAALRPVLHALARAGAFGGPEPRIPRGWRRLTAAPRRAPDRDPAS